MPDQKFWTSFDAGSDNSSFQKVNQAFKSALGLTPNNPADEEEKRKEMAKSALNRRAGYYSDTTSDGGQ